MTEPTTLWGMPIIEDPSIPAASATVGPPEWSYTETIDHIRLNRPAYPRIDTGDDATEKEQPNE